MAYKINIGFKGKTFKVETEDEKLVGYSIGDKIKGEDVSADLAGYELEITGTSDKAGFCGMSTLNGPNLHKVLLGYGKGMHMKPKGETKINRKPNGLRLRKTVRGKEISNFTIQINTKVLAEGSKKFDALFEAPAEEAASETEAPIEAPKEEAKEEKKE
jgi:ribosomal protein S6E (S10)